MTPRVALLSPYWDFFEYSVPDDLRGSRRALAAAVGDALGGVVANEVAESREGGRTAGARIAAAAPDVLVVLQSMAVPPAYALAALDALPRLPLVVFVTHHARRPGDLDHAAITADGATVGGPQLTNVLIRRERPFALVAGTLEEAGERLRVEVRAAATAGRLRRARIARVGRPIDGYDCVDCDEWALREATGIELVSVAPGAVRDAYLTAEGAAVEAEVRGGFDVEAGLACMARSTRFAAALEALDARLGVAAGAMNCHVPEIRLSEEPGIAPCFALGRETTRGIPWTCAGDVVTAVAMLTLKLLAGAALYHEIETLDHGTGEALLANSGEHDLALADGRPRLVENAWWPGACAVLSPPAGAATLVGFTPHPGEPSGFRYVVAEGEFTARRLPRAGTANAAFRFAGDEPVAAAWERWARAGVNHHSAAATGHHGAAVAGVARQLGVGWVSTSAAR